jgi:hypothetical protein
VFDCALHFRFLQKATEAMFEMGQASVAATLACQKRVLDDLIEGKAPASELPTMPAWFAAWSPPPPPAPPPQPDIMQSWMAMANACSAYWMGAQTVAASGYRPVAITPFPAAAQAIWGVTPWTMYQAPMVAMMLSYGVPYAVAAPTARASTSAMDAADAAYAQWRLVFGSPEGQKSLQQNASHASHWSGYLH